MPMKIATRTTVLSQMLVFRSNGDAKTVALHLTRLTMWGYHRVCSTMMGSWTSLPQNLALTKTRPLPCWERTLLERGQQRALAILDRGQWGNNRF